MKINLDKIRREPIYSEFFERYGEQACLDAGFFYDSNAYPINWDVHDNLLCTPLAFLQKPNPIHGEPCVLLSTGAMSPMHEGHISMMGSALNALRMRGKYQVLGGYLSPGHDEYIREKTGKDWIHINARLDIGHKIIQGSEYSHMFAVDPWEGMFAPGAVNFTSVVYRLKRYLDKHFAKGVKVFFVCGGDNARFAQIFKDTEFGCIVIDRMGSSREFDKHMKSLADCNNIIFAGGNSGQSSTAIRKSDGHPNSVKNIRKRQSLKKQLHLRMSKRHAFYESQVLNQLSPYFSHVWVESLDEQHEQIPGDSIDGCPVLNMDSMTDHGMKLEVARHYDLFGQMKLGVGSRPGHPKIHEQLQAMVLSKPSLKDTGVYLFDDDICSGASMNKIEFELNHYDVAVHGRLSFISGQSETREVLDAKDFIFNYMDGGLVVEFQDELIRVPYMYPFVCPYSRGGVSDPVKLSAQMWMISHLYWLTQRPEAVVGDYPHLNWLTELDHSKDTKLSDLCKYYYELMVETYDHHTFVEK